MKIIERILIALGCLLVLWLAVVKPSLAQSVNVPVSANLTWSSPTTATDGSPLAGPQALTKFQLYASTSTIPANIGSAPQAELPPGATSHTYTTTVANGATLYFRLRACNAGGCSVLSNEATKVVTVAAPGAPGSVTVTVTVVVAAP